MSHPYDQLSPDVVMDAVESLGFEPNARNLELNSYENRVFQIGVEPHENASNGFLVGKFYRPERWTNETILEEHSFSQKLKDNDLPVVAPLTLDGSTLHTINGFRFALFPRQGGQAPELESKENLEIIGRTLGRIHLLGSSMKFDHRPYLNIEQWAIRSKEFLMSGNFLPDYLIEAYDTLTRDIIQLCQQKWHDIPFQPIALHGDCHPGNILWRDNNPHFVDLDDCIMGPAVQDFWMLIPGEWQENRELLDAMLDGYETFYEFDYRQLHLIETLRTLRIMHYSAWLARRWDDPAFPRAFPWFNTERYWSDHILELREQFAKLQIASDLPTF